MLWKGHVVTASAAMATTVVLTHQLAQPSPMLRTSLASLSDRTFGLIPVSLVESVAAGAGWLWSIMFPWSQTVGLGDSGLSAGVGPLVLPVLWLWTMFWTLISDADGGSSSRTKISQWTGIRLPLRHRGYTHTVWAWGALAVFSVLAASVGLTWIACGAFWAFFGVFWHVSMDRASTARVVDFYPLQKHKVITRGETEIVVSTRFGGLYKVGTSSETRFVLAVILVCALAGWAAWTWL